MIKHLLEYFLLKFFFIILNLLPINIASSIGGFLGKTIGPKLKANKTAKNNFNIAFPNKSNKEIEENILQMWENFGRTVAEYPFLHFFSRSNKRITIEGLENLTKKNSKNAIIFSGHFANWEVMATVIANISNLALIYRAPNNPLVDKMIRDYRNIISLDQIRKGPQGSREIIEFIKKGTNLGMLVDQKQNDGISIPFFGKNAMTSSAIAKLSLKYKLSLIPVSIERISGTNFHIKIHDELEINDQKDDVITIMNKVNNFLEKSIIKNPSQWLWMHKRWN
ncbi:MAG: lauroyl acyltransferase [Rhodospirillaceae bacterium]|nr:lauroyl acyltransferase [Rhodospirillaceae bacterium]|tara:strand:+ start:674 stop:1513 length:840 start_codon:yes stop_codon:yes gene_type:complete